MMLSKKEILAHPLFDIPKGKYCSDFKTKIMCKRFFIEDSGKLRCSFGYPLEKDERGVLKHVTCLESERGYLDEFTLEHVSNYLLDTIEFVRKKRRTKDFGFRI